MAGESSASGGIPTPERVYTEEEQKIVDRMDEAAREDRDRFFAVADTLTFQPKYKAREAEIEEIKQQWRDMTDLPDYPHIHWPMALPDWFPVVKFASRWEPDYLETTLAEQQRMAARFAEDGLFANPAQ